MKKILALALALVMLAALAVPAFADAELGTDGTVTFSDPELESYGTADADDQGTTGTADVKYGVDQTYIVTIPALIVFEPEDYVSGTGYVETQTVIVNQVKLAGTEKITINMTSATGDQATAGLMAPGATDKEAYTLVDLNGKSTPVDYTVTKQELSESAAVTVDADNTLVLELLRPNGNNGIHPVMDKSVITFTTAGTAQEGNYIDRLTFVVAIEPIDGADTDAMGVAGSSVANETTDAITSVSTQPASND